MPKEKLAKVTEVRKGIVGERGRLIAFFTKDTDANVRGLYHIDIVCAVADGHRCQRGEPFGTEVLSDVSYRFSLLRWG